MGIFNIAGSLLASFGFNLFELIFAGRFLLGLSGGWAYVTCPLYLSESVPLRFRGIFAGLGFGMGFGVGQAVAQVLGMVFSEHWPYLFGLTALPGVLGVCLFFWIPESPKFLLFIKDNAEAAVKAVAFYTQEENLSESLQTIEAEERNFRFRSCVISWPEMFKKRLYRQPLIIGILVNMTVSLCAVFIGESDCTFCQIFVEKKAGFSKACSVQD